MRAGCRYENEVFFIGRMRRSGELPVLNVPTGQKSGYSPRRGDSLHRFTSNLARPTGTWVRLAGQNFSSIGTGGVGIRPQKYQKFPRLAGNLELDRLDQDADRPLDRLLKFLVVFLYAQLLAFHISLDSLHRLRSYC